MTKEFVGVGGAGVTEERDVVKESPLQAMYRRESQVLVPPF